MIYWFLFCVLILFSIVDITVDSFWKQPVYMLFVIMIIVFAGTRFETGFDYLNYKYIFEKADLFSTQALVVEVGYLFLCVVCKAIGFGFPLFLIVMAFFSIWLKSQFIIRYSPYLFLSLLIYFSIGVLMNEMGQMRQGIALALVLYSFSFLIQKKRFWFMMLVLLASLIHSSALIVLPSVFIVNARFKLYQVLLIILSGLLFVFIDLKSVTLALIQYIPYFQIQAKVMQYAFYQSDSNEMGINLSLLLRLFIYIVLFMYYHNFQKEYPEINKFLNLYLFGIILYLFFNSIPAFAIRGSLYFKFLDIILVPVLVGLGKGRFNKIVMSVFFTCYCFWSIYKLLLGNDEWAHAFLPYKSVLFYDLF